jgi:hypothetical protein
MPAVRRFDTPGSERDLPDGHPFYDAWHAKVAGLLSPDVTEGNPLGEFFDPSVWDFELVGERRLTWMGFPRTWMVSGSRDDRQLAFEACEDRTVQDEYLEWHVTRRPDGRITKVVFVTETPEYWSELASADRDAVVALYRTLVDPAVPEPELFDGPGGAYNPGNVWNTERGIVHYVQRINTLTAAVGLATAAVTAPAQPDNFEVESTRVTSADPRVEFDIGVLARRDLSITLSDPVGLYMVDWDDTGWAKPDGSPVGDYWRVRRGGAGAAMRLEYEVPAPEGFVVGDIRIGGREIEFGGQIAEHVTVGTGGVAGRRVT